MRTSLSWITRLIFWAGFLLAVGYVALSILLPPWIAQHIAQAFGGAITIERIALRPPFRLVFSGIRAVTEHPDAFMRIERLSVVPARVSWNTRTLWFKTADVSQPVVQLLRIQQGAIVWPRVAVSASTPRRAPPKAGLARDVAPHASGVVPSEAEPSRGTAKWSLGFAPRGSTPFSSASPDVPWRFAIDTLRVSEGSIIFVDRQLASAFRGAMTDVSFIGGPFELPFTSAPHSFAIHAKVVGVQQRAAAVYCSGWVVLRDRGLDVSCQLDPLPLAAFEPYYEAPGPLQVRVYDATLKATVRLTSKSNQLDGRVQLEIGNLSEADLSVFGRTVADIKKLAGDGEPVLRGEVQIAGPLDRLDQWQLTLVPGNEIVQHLMKPLLDRRIGSIPLKVGDQTIPVGLTPATAESAAPTTE